MTAADATACVAEAARWLQGQLGALPNGELHLTPEVNRQLREKLIAELTGLFQTAEPGTAIASLAVRSAALARKEASRTQSWWIGPGQGRYVAETVSKMSRVLGLRLECLPPESDGRYTDERLFEVVQLEARILTGEIYKALRAEPALLGPGTKALYETMRRLLEASPGTGKPALVTHAPRL